MPARTLVLASRSPARLALLEAAGFRPQVLVSGVAEDGVHHLDAPDAACVLAERKAAAVADRLGGDGRLARTGSGAGSATATGAGTATPDGPTGVAPVGRDPLAAAAPAPAALAVGDATPVVVGCDSMLAFAGEVRGKPTSAEQAAAWWRGYRGRQGTLVTGHAVIDMATGRRASAAAETVVRFGRPADAEIDAYVATGEPLAVAGGFTLDGYSAPFVDGIDGDHGTVLGLSLPLLRRLLAGLGVDVTTLWDRR